MAASALLGARSQWTRRIARADLEVWGQSDAPEVADLSGAGVVIGQIRWRTPEVPGRRETAEAYGKQLIRQAWGSYVALLCDRKGWCALRDPSGHLDCLTWRRGGIWLIASDIDELPRELLPSRMALDWDALSLCAATGAAVIGRSPLDGVATLTPGDLVVLAGRRAGEAQPLWRPQDHVGDGSSVDDGQLVIAVEDSVSLALEGAEPTLVEVSGGLDSSIIAGTAGRLGLGGRVAAALHFRSNRPESDESTWANSVATGQGWPIFVGELSPGIFDPKNLFELSCGARPAINAMDLVRDAATVAAAQAYSAGALVTGKGGDTVFFQPPTVDILADYVLATGWRGLGGDLAQGLARRLRRSVWSVGEEARHRLRDRAPPSLTSPLLGPRGRAQATTPIHPWMEGIDDLPPGKQRQIQGIVATFNVRGVTRYAKEMAVRHPLLSQPVIEASLGIPTWRLAPGGRERGLARELFADRVPESVLKRRSKGELGAYYARTIARSGDLLKPFLLDGVLCEAGVLDRNAVEAALAPDTLICHSENPALMSATAVEAFARYWQARLPDWPADARRRRD
ncbi:asparagine synthase-related protein [Phenylobacterium sp.]|uniref:asparagine synthase-related protein n=1 Tax=Phenylobacterium sp. TaxID=1871053 RepID=UPI002E301949|nr:asparagine synthase-related protein [Phenylobacterium sp.]HEX3365706.1 asparagine synthase-related protein [Phenylobacterium sp.]